MKRFFAVMVLAALVAVLSACEVVVSGIDIGVPPGISVSNAGFTTNYRAKVNGVDRFIICDNKTTILSYSFSYSGSLQSWSSFLKGETTGTIKGQASFALADVVVPGRVEVSYTIPAYLAPLSTADLAPQGIIIVEKPVVIGYTRLYLTINGYGKSYPLSGGAIPVVNSCP